MNGKSNVQQKNTQIAANERIKGTQRGINNEMQRAILKTSNYISFMQHFNTH